VGSAWIKKALPCRKGIDTDPEDHHNIRHSDQQTLAREAMSGRVSLRIGESDPTREARAPHSGLVARERPLADEHLFSIEGHLQKWPSDKPWRKQ
jgi:hypothetical protein